jgi:hypothetical protein
VKEPLLVKIDMAAIELTYQLVAGGGIGASSPL